MGGGASRGRCSGVGAPVPWAWTGLLPSCPLSRGVGCGGSGSCTREDSARQPETSFGAVLVMEGHRQLEMVRRASASATSTYSRSHLRRLLYLPRMLLAPISSTLGGWWGCGVGAAVAACAGLVVRTVAAVCWCGGGWCRMGVHSSFVGRAKSWEIAGWRSCVAWSRCCGRLLCVGCGCGLRLWEVCRKRTVTYTGHAC